MLVFSYRPALHTHKFCYCNRVLNNLRIGVSQTNSDVSAKDIFKILNLLSKKYRIDKFIPRSDIAEYARLFGDLRSFSTCRYLLTFRRSVISEYEGTVFAIITRSRLQVQKKRNFAECFNLQKAPKLLLTSLW